MKYHINLKRETTPQTPLNLQNSQLPYNYQFANHRGNVGEIKGSYTKYGMI